MDISDYSLESVKVNCTPSDPLSPVRWRTFLGTYDQLSSPYSVYLNPPLSHVAVFPLVVYEGAPPTRTEVFVCDLINNDDLSLKVDPQMITVRFITSKFIDKCAFPGAGVMYMVGTSLFCWFHNYIPPINYNSDNDTYLVKT